MSIIILMNFKISCRFTENRHGQSGRIPGIFYRTIKSYYFAVMAPMEFLDQWVIMS